MSKGEGRNPLGSEGSNELPGAPVQEVEYSEEVEKGCTEGGGETDEWESEISGEGPSIAVRMEYSRLAASEPKVKDGALRVLDKRSFAVKPSMTVVVELSVPAGISGVGGWT